MACFKLPFACSDCRTLPHGTTTLRRCVLISGSDQIAHVIDLHRLHIAGPKVHMRAVLCPLADTRRHKNLFCRGLQLRAAHRYAHKDTSLLKALLYMLSASHLSAAPSALWRCILSTTGSLRLLSDSASSSEDRANHACGFDSRAQVMNWERTWNDTRAC